jgi:hypothetical protein
MRNLLVATVVVVRSDGVAKEEGMFVLLKISGRRFRSGRACE